MKKNYHYKRHSIQNKTSKLLSTYIYKMTKNAKDIILHLKT